MKRLFLFVFVIMLTIVVFSACGSQAAPAQTPSDINAASVSPSLGQSLSPSPEQSVSVAPSAPDSVIAFQKDPQKFIADTLRPLPGMADLLDNSGLISLSSEEVFSAFWFSSYTQSPDSDQSIDITNSTPYYDLQVPADDSAWSLDTIAKKVGDSLKLNYEDKKGLDENGDNITYKNADGDSAGYSDSRIYFDSDEAVPGTARILFSYGTQNEAFNSLVKDSFSRNIINVPKVLGNYKETYGVKYDFNENIEESNDKVGCVTESWWNVSADDAAAIKQAVKTSGFASADPDDDDKYYISLNDDYYEGALADIFNWGDDENPNYEVDFSIYYKAK